MLDTKRLHIKAMKRQNLNVISKDVFLPLQLLLHHCMKNIEFSPTWLTLWRAKQSAIMVTKILTCRALAPLGLPKSAGLSRRPILLCQSHVTDELNLCSQALPQKVLHSDSDPIAKNPSWSAHYTPYSIDPPRFIWRPPPAPD